MAVEYALLIDRFIQKKEIIFRIFLEREDSQHSSSCLEKYITSMAMVLLVTIRYLLHQRLPLVLISYYFCYNKTQSLIDTIASYNQWLQTEK